jgi:hypothetical protein
MDEIKLIEREYGREAAKLYEKLPEELREDYRMVLEDVDYKAQENGRDQGYWDGYDSVECPEED